MSDSLLRTDVGTAEVVQFNLFDFPSFFSFQLNAMLYLINRCNLWNTLGHQGLPLTAHCRLGRVEPDAWEASGAIRTWGKAQLWLPAEYYGNALDGHTAPHVVVVQLKQGNKAGKEILLFSGCLLNSVSLLHLMPWGVAISISMT